MGRLDVVDETSGRTVVWRGAHSKAATLLSFGARVVCEPSWLFRLSCEDPLPSPPRRSCSRVLGRIRQDEQDLQDTHAWRTRNHPGAIETGDPMMIRHDRRLFAIRARLDRSWIWQAYFEFITTPNVDPTNNLAEQAIRFVVIDRRITMGTRGESGRRWCERIWTTLATCARTGRDVLDFLHQSLLAHWSGQPPPSLLETASP